MPRTAASLLFTGALAAQSLVAPAPYAPVQWLFEPARIDGEPQWARFKLTMPFRLR